MVKEKNHPVLFLTVPVLLAVYAGSLFTPQGLLALASVSLFLFSLITVMEHVSGTRIVHLARFACFGLLLGCILIFAIQQKSRPVLTLAPRNRITTVTGELVSDPVPAGPDFYRCRLKTRFLGTLGGDGFSAMGHADILFPAEFVRQSLPGGLAVKPVKERNLNRAHMDTNRPIIAKGSVLTLPVVYRPGDSDRRDRFMVIGESTGVTGQWVSPLARFRSLLRLSLMRMLYDWKDSGGLLLALLSGNRDYIQPGLSLAFRNAGLSHVLALSGMHLSIIGGIALGFGMGTGGKKFSVRFSLLVLCLFVWFAGNSPSLDRALIMALIAVMLRASGIQTGMVSLLAFSCLIQLCTSPEQAHSPAFMLSYAALLGIILAGKWIATILEPWIPRRAIMPLSASIAAQLFTVPVVAVTFGVLSPAGILAACAVSPFVTVFLSSGLFLVVLGAVFPRIAALFLPAYNGLYRAICEIVHRFATFPRIVLKDLSAMLAAGILCLAGIVLLYVLHERTCARRAPDALFTGL